MTARKLNRFFSADGEHRPVIAKALEINELSRLCRDFVPPELAPLLTAANLKDGRLLILAANAAAAAKLKLLSESLGELLLKQGRKVNSVSVRVQPMSALPADAAPHKQSRFGPGALDELRRLHERMPESAARTALRTLLERHGATPSPADARKK